MFSTLRLKLTLWYAAVLASVLIVFALLFYFLIEQTVRELADDSLADASAALIARLRSNPASDPESIRQTLEDFRFQYIFFAVYDKDGEMIAASPRLQKDARLRSPVLNISAADIPRGVLDKLFRSPDSFETFRLTDRTEVRIYAERAELAEPGLIIATMRPLTSQTELLADIRLFFLAGIPLALLLSSFGGYYLARKSLEPVGEMGERASLITSRNLSERLPVGKKRDELEKLADIFNQMLKRLEISFEQQRQFMADASHELRTPLAIMRGEAEVALQKQNRSEAEYRESLEIIRQEGVRLSHIVEDLFTLARADAGQYKLNPTTFYLDELIGECARAVRTLTADKNLSFAVSTDENLIFRGDEALIRRLIIILLDNAVKYSDAGGRVAVVCSPQDTGYRIEVANTGPAIPEKEREKIFARFYRADKARSHGENFELGTGAGLGLSIGTWIARAHRGRLELTESGTARETVFTVFLPADEQTG